jgi:DNA-directed RNA polymerase beta' subunit
MEQELKEINSEIVGMRLELIDWDEEYKKDLASGIGFDIDDPNGIDKKNNRSDRGIYSNLFGSELSDDLENNDSYSCKCKYLKGRFYDDGKTKCPKCGSLVTYNNNDMKKTGWITLREEIHLINPIFYFMLEKIIGKKHLNNIIYYNKERDKDGNVIIDYDYYDENNPYYSIGLNEFYDKFEEILNYYKDNIKGLPNLREEKIELCKFVLENKDKVFVNHFPVYTLLLRPILMIKNNMIFDKVNSKYQRLLTNVVNLNKTDTQNDISDLKVLPLLYQSQILLNQIHKMIIEKQISGKDGHIRGNILGERVNFSSRCVIVPLVGKYNLNEIKLPYIVFLELYKYEIMNLLCRFDNLTLNEANRRWNKAIEKFDKRVYLIMKYIIENTKGGVYCFVNRNPSLNYGSILTMKVVEVKEDFDDLTLSVPLNVLGLLAADFDGDVINIISIKTQEFTNHYNKIFNPRVMMIDRDNGKFNRKMGLIKDQMIGLYSFCK